MNLTLVQEELAAAHPYYKTFAPGLSSLMKFQFGSKVVKTGLFVLRNRHIRTELKNGTSVGYIVGGEIGRKINKRIARAPRQRFQKELIKASRTRHDYTRKNGIGGRSWITQPGRYRMVIVFHDANRVGPHVDVHIDRLSLVYKLAGKPEITDHIKYKRDGTLTDDSVKVILNHVRSEIVNGSRVAQNIDHSKSNARATWVNGDPDKKGYGAGVSRQIISDTEVDIYKAHHEGPIEMYAPVLNAQRSLYLYRLYPGDKPRTPHKTKAPICIFGVKTADPTGLMDRLHLKMIDPKEREKLEAKADMSTATVKYDGASCYFIIGKKGTTVWSPRTSVKTNERIEYTFKVDGIATATSKQQIVGMGELLFKDLQGNYVPASTVGGILNAQSVVPEEYTPEIRIYRIDKWGRENTNKLGFWENRKLQVKTAKLSDKLKVVDLTTPEKAYDQGHEGYVVVPEGASVNDGFKVKYAEDPHDWRVDAINFVRGEKGGAAGTVEFTSLESGKKFKLGPGAMGDHALHEDMMNNPDNYIDRTAKICSKRGHEGRAAKFLDWHLDK